MSECAREACVVLQQEKVQMSYHAQLPTAGIPDPHRLIPGTRDDAFTIGGPRYTGCSVIIAGIGELEVSTAGIPDLHRFILRSRGDALAIGRPHYTPYITIMAIISVRLYWRIPSWKTGSNEKSSSSHT